MSTSAEVVVVGGGVLGVSTALHLLLEGASDVVVLERDGLAQATSAAGAGLVGTWAAGSFSAFGDEELEVERYGLRFYGELAERGYEFGYKQNGCLWVAADEDAWRYLVPIAEHEAVPDRRTLTPEEVEACAGIVRADPIVRGVLHPSNCQVSAQHATLAIAAECEAGGGRIETRTPVMRVVVADGAVRAVETPRGRVDTGTVVLAAGAWTNELLREHGVFAPMAPLVASRIVTEPLGVPPTMPTLYFPGFSSHAAGFLWMREEQGGLLWGTRYESAPRYQFVDGDVPERFDQLPLDGIADLRRLGEKLSAIVPALARYRSFAIAHGAPCYTSDARALLGEVPDIEGLYVLGGCNETGVTHGPGWGKALAERIVYGESRLVDIDAWRLDRFGDALATVRDVVANRKVWREPAPRTLRP